MFTIVVANFIGGYIPYIGAFLGGGLAVIIALGDGGLPVAAIMLVVVLAANLLLENFVEPKVMGRTLDIHPLVVLVVTAWAASSAASSASSSPCPSPSSQPTPSAGFSREGFFKLVADRAEPTVQRMLE